MQAYLPIPMSTNPVFTHTMNWFFYKPCILKPYRMFPSPVFSNHTSHGFWKTSGLHSNRLKRRNLCFLSKVVQLQHPIRVKLKWPCTPWSRRNCVLHLVLGDMLRPRWLRPGDKPAPSFFLVDSRSETTAGDASQALFTHPIHKLVQRNTP